MGFLGKLFRSRTREPKPNWSLGDLKDIGGITLDDMKDNPVWINDCSGEWEDSFDESSVRPVLDTHNISQALLDEYVSVSVLAEFTETGEMGSVDIEPDGSITRVSVWRNGEWIIGRQAFDANSGIEIRAVPSILGEHGVCFIYDPNSDKGKRK